MNPYVYLAGAIAAEIVGTTALDISEGFTRPVASAFVLVGYATSFALLGFALEGLPIGLTYATWSAIGVTAIAVIGVLFRGEHLDAAGVLGLALIVAGVFVLNVVSGTAAH